MNLIALLIGLAIERLATQWFHWRRMRWLDRIIDAGFDEFVRNHWDSLVAGEKKRFLFPFAERDSLVELRIKPAACNYPTETDQCFKLELSNWFVRMLVKPIELGFCGLDTSMIHIPGS